MIACRAPSGGLRRSATGSRCRRLHVAAQGSGIIWALRKVLRKEDAASGTTSSRHSLSSVALESTDSADAAPLPLPRTPSHAKVRVAEPEIDAGEVPVAPLADYGRASVFDIARIRGGWLAAFCVGLLAAAVVVEQYESVLEHHVELSFFVPLIMGHGGNTGSQAVTTVIRALALNQISNRDIPRVVLKEAGAGCLMGGLLGLAILVASLLWDGVSTEVGATVAVALPLVSLWANGLGAFLTLMADRLRFDPAVTSVPLMTTIIDSTGLILYFQIARWMLGIE